MKEKLYHYQQYHKNSHQLGQQNLVDWKFKKWKNKLVLPAMWVKPLSLLLMELKEEMKNMLYYYLMSKWAISNTNSLSCYWSNALHSSLERVTESLVDVVGVETRLAGLAQGLTWRS